MNRHLNDQEFTDALLREASFEAAVHLRDCDACRKELEELAAGLAQLRTAVVAWSDRTHATSGVHPVPRWKLPRVAGSAAFAASLVLLTFCLLPAVMGRPVGNHSAGIVRAATSPDHPAKVRVAEDNQLLEAVNREISEQVAPAMQPLQVSTSREGSSAIATKRDEVTQ